MEVYRYRYRTAKDNGQFELFHRDQDRISTIRVADHGSVWIDPHSSHVLRVESESGDAPASFPIRYSRITLHYGPAAIGGRTYLLPARAQVEIRTRTSHAQRRGVHRVSQV